MRWWMTKWRPLAGGAITLGVLQAVQDVNFNQLWYELLFGWLLALLSLFLGEDMTSAFGGGSSFGSSFL